MIIGPLVKKGLDPHNPGFRTRRNDHLEHVADENMVRHRDGAGTAPVRAQRAHWFGSKPPRMESSPPSRRARPRRFDDSIACPRRPESLRSGLIPCRSRRPVRQIEPLAILDAIELNGIGSVRATTVFRQCRFCLCERQRQVVYGFSPFSGPPILKKRRRPRRAPAWRGRTQPLRRVHSPVCRNAHSLQRRQRPTPRCVQSAV